MLRGFRDFVLKGNVVDLAVAVIIATAFGVLVASLVANLFTPLIAAIAGQPSFGDLSFTINGSEFRYGRVINDLISFLAVAAVVYFVVVIPMNRVMERLMPGKSVDDPVRACPECLSDIPGKATRCAFCTAQVTPEATA